MSGFADTLVTTIIPYIPEIPGQPMNGAWGSVMHVRDNNKKGFVRMVNAASGGVQTPWMLLWNSDAKPLFSFEELKLALRQCEPEVKVAGFAQVPPQHVIEKTHGRVRGKVAVYWNVGDSGPYAVHTDAAFSKEMGRGGLHGSAYCPLYAVRTDWFRNVGGLSPIYGPGYYDDAHFWRWTRRLGGATVVYPGLHYEHAQRASFEAVYSKETMKGLAEENLRRYLLSWGALEPGPIPESSPLASLETSSTSTEAGES